VNFIFPYLMILGAIGFMFGTGGSALVTKYMGEEKNKLAKETFTMIVSISFFIGIIILIVGLISIRQIASLLGADGLLLENCVTYGSIIIFAIPFFILQMEFQSFFVSANKPKLGLFVTLAFHDKAFTENIIYSKLLSDKLDANLGYIYENLVAQMLRSAGHELFYHTFPAENNHNYEVDFLLSRGNKIIPIEVKSSGYKTHKSLDAFCNKYSSRISNRILLYTKDYQKDGTTICLPIYFTSLL
jgi:Holliday junction resolvase-like predicted endonuclease